MHKKLVEISEIRNWIEFGDALKTASSEPRSYGLRTADEVIRHIANLQGKKPDTLRNPMVAAQWLKQRFPEIYQQRPAGLGMTLVLFLMKIGDLEPEAADGLAQRVFRREVTHAELKRVYDRLRADKVSDESSGITLSVAERARQFGQVVEMFVHAYGPQAFGLDSLTVHPGKLLKPVSPDLLVYGPNDRRIAIEIKSYRSRADKNFAIKTLGYLSLIQKLVPEVIMIVPDNSAYDLDEMVKLRDQLTLSGIRFATLPEEGGDAPQALRIRG